MLKILMLEKEIILSQVLTYTILGKRSHWSYDLNYISEGLSKIEESFFSKFNLSDRTLVPPPLDAIFTFVNNFRCDSMELLPPLRTRAEEDEPQREQNGQLNMSEGIRIRVAHIDDREIRRSSTFKG